MVIMPSSLGFYGAASLALCLLDTSTEWWAQVGHRRLWNSDTVTQQLNVAKVGEYFRPSLHLTFTYYILIENTFLCFGVVKALLPTF